MFRSFFRQLQGATELYTTYKNVSPYYSGKFPRTLQQAFGPYSEWVIDRRSLFDRVGIFGWMCLFVPLMILLACFGHVAGSM